MDWDRLRIQEAFTLQDVAYLLNVSKRQVEQLVVDGVLRSIVLPGTERWRRVTRAQLDVFILNAEMENGFRRPKC